MTRVLVTGATGFVGRALCRHLTASGAFVRAALRSGAPDPPLPVAEQAHVGAIDGRTEWRPALQGIDTVLHLAARTHVLHDTAADPLAEYRRINAHGTARLAQQAAESGARRLVFVSSVKVNGERTTTSPFRESDAPAPEDAYGASKQEAERALHDISAATGLEAVVVRPPLVYGPGVKANFLRMIRAVDSGLPLPLAGIRNRRSILYVENLVDLLTRTIGHPAAPGETFLVSDGPAVSTPDLLRMLALALGRPARLIHVPPSLLVAASHLAGRGPAGSRLTGSLEVDITHACTRLGWSPPHTTQQGIDATVAWYRQRRT